MQLIRGSRICLLTLLALAALPRLASGAVPTTSTGTTANVVTEETRLKNLPPLVVQAILENPEGADTRLVVLSERTPFIDRLPGNGKARGRGVWDTACSNVRAQDVNLRRLRARFDADSGVAYAGTRVTAARQCAGYLSVAEFTGNQAQPVGSNVSTTINLQNLPADADSDCFEPETLCLNGGRFKVRLDWRSTSGGLGSAVGLAQADNQGLFYFLDSTNWRMLVKVTDGCSANDHFWVHYGAAAAVSWELTVEDTETDQVRTYTNPLGQASPALVDTTAFATCP